MNKLSLFFSFLMAAFTATAQDTTTDFKPEAGNKSLETNISGYGFNAYGFRYRAFSSPTSAFRITTSANYDYCKVSENGSRSSFSAWVAPGIEKHFAGTNRLSPYLGVELPLGFRRARYETEEVKITGGDAYFNGNNYYPQSHSNVSVGVNGVAGVDFYISKNFYTGIELSVGANYYNNADIEVAYKGVNAPSSSITEGYHGFRFNAFNGSGLRLGFIF